MLKLGIMQPYFFPYIGYFQYMSACDIFIFYDDVAFIRQGWINRNRILVNGEAHLFSIPVEQISSFRPINQTAVHSRSYPAWKNRWMKTLEHSYRKAPYYPDVMAAIEPVLSSNPENISSLAISSIGAVFTYIDHPLPELVSTKSFDNSHLSGQDRILDFCLQLGATQYINPEGGQHMYHRDDFARAEIELKFLKSLVPEYSQFDFPWVPSLSIVDVLMFNNKEEVRNMLKEYILL